MDEWEARNRMISVLEAIEETNTKRLINRIEYLRDYVPMHRKKAVSEILYLAYKVNELVINIEDHVADLADQMEVKYD